MELYTLVQSFRRGFMAATNKVWFLYSVRWYENCDHAGIQVHKYLFAQRGPFVKDVNRTKPIDTLHTAIRFIVETSLRYFVWQYSFSVCAILFETCCFNTEVLLSYVVRRDPLSPYSSSTGSMIFDIILTGIMCYIENHETGYFHRWTGC